jgi:transposase-like protein
VPKRQYTQTQQQAIDTVKSQFQTWRISNGNSRRRIPDDLRATAIELSNSLGRTRASKELGLNPTDLKHWENLMAPEKNVDFKFAEVTLHHQTSCLDCRVEVSREKTSLALDLKGVNVDQMITLIRGLL